MMLAEGVATYLLQRALGALCWVEARVRPWTTTKRVVMSDPLGTSYKVNVECPHCGFQASRATSHVLPRAPEKDDASICARCTSIIAYGEDGLVEVPEGLWEAWGPELHEELAQSVEVAANVVRTGEYQVDAVIWRGPDDWRAVITMKNGLFVVSPPFSRRHLAQSALKRARQECIIFLKWARGLDEVPTHWFGQIFLAVFNEELPICPILGPFPSHEVAVQLMQPQGVALARELGLEVKGMLVIDKRTKSQSDAPN